MTQRSKALLLVAVGVAVAAVAGALAWESAGYAKDGVRVEARVIDHVRDRHSDEKSAHHFVAEFADAEGRDVEFVSTESSKTMQTRFPAGSNVALLYLPGEPEKARRASFFGLWGWPLLAGAFGVFLVVVGFHVRPRRGEA